MVCDRHPRAEWDSVLVCLTCQKEQDALMREAAALLRQPEVTNAWLDKARVMADRLEGKA